MIMKMHSYMATNGYLQYLNRKFEHTMNKLRSATSQVGGWDVAITEAGAVHSDKDARATSTTPEEVGVSPSISPMPGGTQRSYIDGDVAVALRKKLLSVPQERDRAPHDQEHHGDEKPALKDPKKDYSILVHHPNEDIAALAEELVDMDSELTSQGPNKVRWPDNTNWRSFVDYMLIPTLVYELEFPRTDKYVILFLHSSGLADLMMVKGFDRYTYSRRPPQPLVHSPCSIRLRRTSYFRSYLPSEIGPSSVICWT